MHAGRGHGSGRVSAVIGGLPRPTAGRRAQACLLALLVAGTLSLGQRADALPVAQPLDFTAAPQSLWGPGASTLGFNYSASRSVSLPFGLGSVSVGYSVGASTGSVSGTFNGTLTTDYTPLLSAPGMTVIGLSYQGDPNGGSLSSTVGAHAQLTSSLGNIGPDYQLDIDRVFTPQLDQTVSGSDSVDPVATLPIASIIGASAGVSLGVTQTDTFTATGIGGSLLYSRQGSGVVDSVLFTLATNTGLGLSVDLDAPGIWDFWFVSPSLANTFSTSFAMDLGLYAESAVGCGPFPFVQPCYTSYTLVSPTVYSGSGFALAFDTPSLEGFSIEVSAPASTVPEPTSLALLGIGVLGLGRLRRRRRHPAEPRSR